MPRQLGWNADVLEPLPRHLLYNPDEDATYQVEALLPHKRRLMQAARIFRILYS